MVSCCHYCWLRKSRSAEGNQTQQSTKSHSCNSILWLLRQQSQTCASGRHLHVFGNKYYVTILLSVIWRHNVVQLSKRRMWTFFKSKLKTKKSTHCEIIGYWRLLDIVRLLNIGEHQLVTRNKCVLFCRLKYLELFMCIDPAHYQVYRTEGPWRQHTHINTQHVPPTMARLSHSWSLYDMR